MRRPWVRWALAALAVVWLGIAAVPMIAAAQRTGGSFGGGSFGGGSSYSGGGYSGGYRSSGGGGGCFTCGSPVIFIAVILLIHFMRARGGSGIGGTGIGAPTHGARGWGQVDISAIRLGVDWRARRELQAQLDRLARSGQTGTPAGLANLLRETVLSLRRCELSWLYCEIANYHPMSSAMAEGIFRQLTTDARARFREELVRNADGTTSTRDAQAMKARSDEGEGVVVVTLVVASRREIVDIHEIQDANRIKTLLDDMVATANPQSLVAMEVIWSPAQEDDRMSTAELEQFYPTLRKIDERSIAGRVFCAYCRGPFAMELLTCPHCGAPAPGTENRGAPR